jgi:hypothetical protein
MNRSRTMHLLCALGIMLGTSGITAFPTNKTITSAVVGFTVGLLSINVTEALYNGTTLHNWLLGGSYFALACATFAVIDAQIPKIREQNPYDDCPEWDEAPLGYQYIAYLSAALPWLLYLITMDAQSTPTING